MTHSELFCVLSLQDYEVERRQDETLCYKINLPIKTETLWIRNHESLRENHSDKNIIWLSGGGTYIINSQWVPLVQRSLSSPSNPGKLTIATGRADSMEELSDPKNIIRELFEEIVLFSDQETVLSPDLDQNLESQPFMRESLKMAHIPFRRFQKIPGHLEKSLCSDDVKVYCNGVLKNKASGLVHHNRDNGEFNLLYAIHLDIKAPLATIAFQDTECAPINGKMSSLNRKVFLYHLPTKDVYAGYQDEFSKVNNHEELSFTSHAWFLLQKIHGLYEREPFND